jgi:hypothetical protein
MHSMTAVVCKHVANNTNVSQRIGTICVQTDGGSVVEFKMGQTIIKKHYGNPYWKEAGVHVVALGENRYLLPTQVYK